MVAPDGDGGISTYTRYLIQELEKIGSISVDKIENRLLESNPFFYWSLAGDSKELHTEVATQHSYFPFDDIVDWSPDVVHVQHEFGLFGHLGIGGLYSYFYYPRLRDQTVVTTLHEVESLGEITGYNKIMEFLGTRGRRFLTWPLFRWSDAIIVHNERSKEILEDIGVENVNVVPHGVVQGETKNKIEAKDYLNFKHDRKVVTIFGFINKFKGHDRVVEQIDELHDDIVIYIAGRPSSTGADKYRDKLIEAAKEKGCENKLEFHGYVQNEEFPFLFGASDLLVFPYRHITESGAMSLALGHGCPVLASGLPAFKDKPIEICEGNWAERINELVHDKEKLNEMKTNSEKYAEERSWKKVAEKTAEVYRKVF
jgi:glycosyltransferase involved in cell wall biosynthesis